MQSATRTKKTLTLISLCMCVCGREIALRLQRQEEYELASMRYKWDAEERKRQAAAAAAAAVPMPHMQRKPNLPAGGKVTVAAVHNTSASTGSSSLPVPRSLLADHLPANLRGNSSEAHASQSVPDAWGVRRQTGANNNASGGDASLLPTSIWGGLEETPLSSSLPSSNPWTSMASGGGPAASSGGVGGIWGSDGFGMSGTPIDSVGGVGGWEMAGRRNNRGLNSVGLWGAQHEDDDSRHDADRNLLFLGLGSSR
jgi:hypothetical protein